MSGVSKNVADVGCSANAKGCSGMAPFDSTGSNDKNEEFNEPAKLIGPRLDDCDRSEAVGSWAVDCGILNAVSELQ